jgi:molybdate/tungstate transport system permease protein
VTATQTTTEARRAARSWPSGWFGVVTWLLGGLLLAFIVLPIIRLVTTSSVASLRHAAGQVAVRDAILLSLQAAAITAGIATLLGVPLAYLLARGSFRGRGVIQSLDD